MKNLPTWVERKFILLIKILNNWKSIHSSFLLNENSYLALMYGQTPLKILQVDIISFHLTTKLLYGDNYSHFTKTKNWERDSSVMCKWQQLDTGRIWASHLQSPWLPSAQTEAHTVCTVNAELVSWNSAWIRRQRAHVLSASLSPQRRVRSEADSRIMRDLKSVRQEEWRQRFYEW